MEKSELAVYAKSIREAATKYLKWNLAEFKGDADMIRTARQDAKDLREVAKLLREGKVSKAYAKADYLDTLVREVIPNEAWEVLQGWEDV